MDTKSPLESRKRVKRLLRLKKRSELMRKAEGQYAYLGKIKDVLKSLAGGKEGNVSAGGSCGSD